MTAQQAPDLEPCEGATLDDLSIERIEAYREEVERRRPGSPLVRAPQEVLLVEVGAAVGERSRLEPTLTGVLFFGREPQRFYPAFTITFLHFADRRPAPAGGEGSLYLDNREFSGTLPEVIDKARATLYEKLGKQGVVEGFRRHDVLDYPEFAYREAIVNAVGHRDYRQSGSFIQVRLFPDRLEVQSPGGLGGNLTVDNIVYEQYTRNPHIMRLLEELGYVEKRGLGVDLMIRAMREAGLELPVFENRGSSFWVTLMRRQPEQPVPDMDGLGLNERQARAMVYLRRQGSVTNREYQQEFGVSERTALYDLQGLVEAGLVLPVSSGRGRYYILRE